jgi:translation initiation factor 1 (eIF-1/SUI1)
MSNKNKNPARSGLFYQSDYSFEKNDKRSSQHCRENSKTPHTNRKKSQGRKNSTVVDGFIGKHEDLESLAKNPENQMRSRWKCQRRIDPCPGRTKEKVVRILNEMGYKAK